MKKIFFIKIQFIFRTRFLLVRNALLNDVPISLSLSKIRFLELCKMKLHLFRCPRSMRSFSTESVLYVWKEKKLQVVKFRE